MKTIESSQTITIPVGIDCTVKSRQVTITGPRGTLARDFTHLSLEIVLSKDKRTVTVTKFFGSRKEIAAIRTVCSAIKNLITGVTKGFKYSLRYVFAHFPVNVTIHPDGSGIEVRNFVGQKEAFCTKMLHGCIVERNEKSVGEIVVSGNDIDLVSQSASSIQQSCKVKNKDIRKFLDGIYVSKKGHIVEDE